MIRRRWAAPSDSRPGRCFACCSQVGFYGDGASWVILLNPSGQVPTGRGNNGGVRQEYTVFSARRPSTTTRMFIVTVVLLAAAVGATQRGSRAGATTGCGSDAPTVTVRVTDVVPGYWWQHALYNATVYSKTRGGPLLDHLAVPLPTPLAAGRYDVTVVTMDDHSPGLFPDRAPYEQLVIALEPPPTLGVYTNPTQDLPDDRNHIESAVGTLEVGHDTETVWAVHRSIPEPSVGSGYAFANSIVPEAITFRCLPAIPSTTTTSTVPSTTTTTVPPSTTTSTVPVPSTTAPIGPTTTAPTSTVPPTLLPATDGADVSDQVLRTGKDVEGNVPSAPAAVETNFVPTYNG